MFKLKEGEEIPSSVGIPDDFGELDTEAGWEYYIANYFQIMGDEAVYEYDFGDGWNHKIILESINAWNTDLKYPRCLSGERACPPEDCGGSHGYYNLLKTLRLSPKNDEYKETTHWLRNHAKNYHPYKPEYFNPSKVHFWNPKKRFDMAFSE